MKRFFLLVLTGINVSCCVSSLRAQNLVLNPGFEQFSSCPQGISEFYLCTDWSTTCTPASDSCSTPDLYATCSPVIGGVNIPNCLLGYHEARSGGTGFAGIILGDGFPGCLETGDDYREYIEGQLSSPLVSGQKYLVVFYVSLASGGMWGSNSFGVYFSNTQYVHDACPNSLIPVTPQLTMCGAAIMDTVNWVPIQWIYTAIGGEQYFTIGNFNDDANTNHVVLNCESFNPYIYYYIDDVSISPYGPGDSSSAANNDCAVTIQTDSVNATCGASNGSIVATVSGCTTPFTYKWSTGGTATSLQNIPAGSYILTVTDVTNCAESVMVTVNSEPLVVTETATNPSCGSNNGTITITPSMGTGPYSYAWSNGDTSATLSNLGAGAYAVTVTGAPGCLAVDSLSLLGASGLTITPVVTNASCGNNNGSIIANITGGSPPYTYSWSTGQTTDSITGLAAGMYTLTAIGDTSGSVVWSEDFGDGGTTWTLNTPGTGTNGGDANQWIVNNDNTCQCTTGNYLHITCNSASFYCLLSGGTCTYLEFPAELGVGDYATDELAISPIISTLGKSNLTLTFTYLSLGNPGTDYGLVDLSNDGGSTWTALPTQYDNVDNCTLATVSIPITYQNIANFRIAFEWINSAGSLDGAANPPGFAIDSITLTAATSNCPAIASVNVSSVGGLTAVINSTAPSCNLNNGTATVSVTAGTGPFSYAWNNGDTTATISNLGTGSYTVTVTNTSNCFDTASVSLFVGSGNITLVPSAVSATCGNPNGSAQVTASGGSGYTYLWSNNATTSSISNLGGGTYTVTVTGAGGCSVSTSITVDSLPPGGNISLQANHNIICPGDSTTICAPSGCTNYIWNNGQTTQCITTQLAGDYYVTVTEIGGCSATSTPLSISVLQPPPVNISISGDTLTAYNAVTYQWYYNGVPLPGDTNDVLVAAMPGSYSIAVSDTNGCVILSNAVNITGISSLVDEMALKVYPDPATDELNVSYRLNLPATLQINITDITGRRIANVLNENELSGNYLQHINIHNLASAVYILSFISDSGSVNLRFVKE